MLRGHKNHIHSETTRKVGSQNIMLLPSRKETRIFPISLVFVGIFYRPYYFTNCLFPFSKLSMSHLLARGVVFTPLSDFQVDTNCTESCVAWSSAHGHRRRLDKLFYTYPTRIFSAQACLQQTTLDKTTQFVLSYQTASRVLSSFIPGISLLISSGQLGERA